MKTKWTFISIERNIGVRVFKIVYIIVLWANTDSFMNGNISILKVFFDIQNYGSEYINSCNRNDGS